MYSNNLKHDPENESYYLEHVSNIEQLSYQKYFRVLYKKKD